jgi:hypothetical protein
MAKSVIITTVEVFNCQGGILVILVVLVTTATNTLVVSMLLMSLLCHFLLCWSRNITPLFGLTYTPAHGAPQAK